MSKPRLLDLFCGAGGAAMGYSRAGFEVVGVDKEDQPRYPFRFIRADALEFMDEGGAEGFDAIHASPPCQHHSAITRVRGNHMEHPELIAPTRERLVGLDVPWVMENVERSTLRQPVTICAVACGLGIEENGRRYVLRRHRLFEASVSLLVPPCACRSSIATVLGIYGGGTRQDTRIRRNLKGGNTQKANRAQAQALMEMPWATRSEMNQAIPPAYTELIGHQLLQYITTHTKGSLTG